MAQQMQQGAAQALIYLPRAPAPLCNLSGFTLAGLRRATAPATAFIVPRGRVAGRAAAADAIAHAHMVSLLRQ